ncbi:MAG: C25 family cysteine peptidase, partial [Acidimicrobiia bacterium]
ASSGLTEPHDQNLMNEELYRQLFYHPNPITLGEAMLAAKASVSDPDVRKTWILFGDPTLKLH